MSSLSWTGNVLETMTTCSLQCIGGKAARAAIYPQALCGAICRGVRKQKTHNTSRVSTGRMSADGVRTLVQGLTLLNQQGISSISKILSTATKDGITGPVGDYPDWWIDTWHDEDGGCDDRTTKWSYATLQRTRS